LISETVENAKKIVDYVRNHNLLSGSLKLETQLTLIRPNETRFGTNALMMDRLSDADEEIKQLFVSRKADELYRSLNRREAKEKFNEVRGVVQNMDFWSGLRQSLRLLLPVLHIVRLCDNSRRTDAVGHIYHSMLELQEFYKTG
jgi:hypothetical protein